MIDGILGFYPNEPHAQAMDRYRGGPYTGQVHIFREWTDGGLRYLERAERAVSDGWHKPRGPGRIEFAKACCRYMREFYAAHGVKVKHYVVVEQGWTVSYLEVED